MTEHCLGTCSIKVQIDGENEKSGIMATFSKDSHLFDVMIAIGTDTYQQTIDMSHVKGEKWTRDGFAKAITAVSSHHRDDEISLTFTLKEFNAAALKMVVKEQIQSSAGLVRVVWSGELNKIVVNNDDGAASTETSSLLPLRLGKCLAHEETTVSNLQDKITCLEENLRMAHATIEKLDSVVQTEKDEQMERFLVLFNELKDKHLAPAKRKIKQLEQELEIAKSLKSSSAAKNSIHKPSAFDYKEDDYVSDHDSDLDNALLDPDLVDRLAAGPSKSKKRKLDEASSSSSKATNGNGGSFASPVATSTARRNPLNGAIEMWDAKGIFEQDDRDDQGSSNDISNNKMGSSNNTSDGSKDEKMKSSSETDMDIMDDSSSEKRASKPSIRSNDMDDMDDDSDADIIWDQKPKATAKKATGGSKITVKKRLADNDSSDTGGNQKPRATSKKAAGGSKIVIKRPSVDDSDDSDFFEDHKPRATSKKDGGSKIVIKRPLVDDSDTDMGSD